MTERQCYIIARLSTFITTIFWGVLVLFMFLPIRRDCEKMLDSLNEMERTTKEISNTLKIIENKCRRIEGKAGH